MDGGGSHYDRGTRDYERGSRQRGDSERKRGAEYFIQEARKRKHEADKISVSEPSIFCYGHVPLILAHNLSSYM